MDFKSYKKQIKDNKNFLHLYLNEQKLNNLSKILKNCPIWLFNNENNLSMFLEQTKLIAKQLYYDLGHDVAYLLRSEEKQELYNIKRDFSNKQSDYMKNPQRSMYIYNQHLPYKQMIILLNKNTPKAFHDEIKGVDFSFFHEISHIIFLFHNENNLKEININPMLNKIFYNLSTLFLNNEIIRRKLDNENILETYADLMAIYLMNKKSKNFDLSKTVNELINFRIHNKITHNDYTHDSSIVLQKFYENNFFNISFEDANEIFLIQSIKNFYEKALNEIIHDECVWDKFSQINYSSVNELPQSNQKIKNYIIDLISPKKEENLFIENSTNLNTNDLINIITSEINNLDKLINIISQCPKKEVKLNK